MRVSTRPSLRSLGLAAVLAAVALAAGILYVGHVLTRPAVAVVGTAPADLQAREVAFASRSGQAVRGWFAAGRPGAGAVLLLHPVRANRTAMLGRARFLHKLGFSVLLVDLQAHGETGGERITFGHREGMDAEAGVAELMRLAPGEAIGAIGVSLGAASLVLSQAHTGLKAVVLESMYPTITDAVQDRLALHLGDWARHLSPLLLWQMAPRLGVTPSDLRPIERMSMLRAPVLLVHGTEDRHTRVEEARSVYQRIAGQKELYLVDGAAHVDLHGYARAAYEVRVARFLARLGKAGG